MFAASSNTTMSQGVTTHDIIEKLNKTVLSNVADVVSPFVDQINASKKRDSLIAEVLRSLPEYKALLAENNHLREITGNTGVKIQIKEKMTTSESVNSIDSLRQEYDIPQSDNIVSDVKTVKTVKTDLSNDSNKDTQSDDHLQSKIKSWSVKLEEFAALIDINNALYDDFSTLKYEFDILFGNNGITSNETVITVNDSEWGSILGNKINKTLAKLEAVAAVVPTEGSLDNESEEEDDNVTVDEEEEEDEDEDEDEDDEDEEEEDEEEEEEDEDEDEEVVSEEEEDDGTVDDEEEEEEDAEEEKPQEESSEELEVIEMEDEDGNPLEYLTNDPDNGDIYELLDGDEVGKKIGKFVDGEPEFFD